MDLIWVHRCLATGLSFLISKMGRRQKMGLYHLFLSVPTGFRGGVEFYLLKVKEGEKCQDKHRRAHVKETESQIQRGLGGLVCKDFTLRPGSCREVSDLP